MPLTSPTRPCVQKTIQIYIHSTFSRGRHPSLVAKSTDSELGIPAPKLTSCGTLEKLLNFLVQHLPCGKMG